MNEAIKQIMMDLHESRVFQKDPHRYLDTRFGEGTARAYFTKHESNRPYVDMRTPGFFGNGYADLARERDMAMSTHYFTGWTDWGTTSSTTASGTNSVLTYADLENIKHNLRARASSDIEQAIQGERSKPPVKRLVRNVPFVCGSGDLLRTLQRDFNHWAKPQMVLIGG